METFLITNDYFKRRLVDLCLRSGLTEFPTKRRDQLLLLKSIVSSFEADKVYSEIEVNELIKRWRDCASCFAGWDHVTLRRSLVDDKFLGRNQDGSSYWLDPSGPPEIAFDPGIQGIDLKTIFAEGQQVIAQRKAEYLRNYA